jgi:hypothetical protein
MLKHKHPKIQHLNDKKGEYLANRGPKHEVQAPSPNGQITPHSLSMHINRTCIVVVNKGVAVRVFRELTDRLHHVVVRETIVRLIVV